MSDAPTPPEGQAPEPAPAGPDWSSFEQAGITPDRFEQVKQAVNMYEGLRNLDTRQQYLQQVINPQYDAPIIQGMFGQQQEQPDPWQQFQGGDDEQYEYEEQPQYTQPAFDPEMFRQAVQHEVQQGVQGMWQQLNEMAMQQTIKDSAASAAKSAGIPDRLSGLIEQQVAQQQKLQPNRQASDIAKEIATTLKNELMQWQAQPAPNQPPASGPPSGPIPGEQRPRTMEEALEWSRQALD